MKKRCDTFQKKQKQSGWDQQIHSEYLQTQSLVSLIKSILKFLYTSLDPTSKGA